jgi:hypothetical protein
MMYVGRCETYDIADFYSGQKVIHSQLMATSEGFALLCPFDDSNSSSLMLFRTAEPHAVKLTKRIELSDSRYCDLVGRGDEIYAVGFNNNSYQSTLTRISGDDIIGVNFDGHANGLAIVEGDIIVADGDLGIRRFRVDQGNFEEISTIE